MKITSFKLEEFWKTHEFSTPYLLCPSDAEGLRLDELLALADPASLSLWEKLHLGYTESPGHPILREEIAKLYRTIKPDQILTTAGAEEGIYCALQTLVFPLDHVIIITPCYQSLEAIPIALGAEVSKIELDPNKGWQLEIDQLKNAFRPSTKLVVINYPHNPTGVLLKKEILDALIHLAKSCGAYIFSDEVYRYLEIDESKRLPSIADLYEKGISLNVMTKSFGLAGLRIGWIATQDSSLLNQIGSYKLYTSICNSAPSEVLAIIALRAKEQILKRNRSILLENLKHLDTFFERHSTSLRWIRPECGTTTFPELLLQISIEQFTQELKQKAGVLIMPGSIFNVSGNFFRIGFGRKNMPGILKRFEQVLEEYEAYY